VKYQLATAAAAALFLALALAAGVHRKGALVGASISGVTALGSVLAIGWTSRGRKPLQAALAVMAFAFLARIVLVALGTVLVARSGASVGAFVLAFFVPYFVFAAIEAAYVHSLRHRTGPTA
jgi:hypothetical protein